MLSLSVSSVSSVHAVEALAFRFFGSVFEPSYLQVAEVHVRAFVMRL